MHRFIDELLKISYQEKILNLQRLDLNSAVCDYIVENLDLKVPFHTLNLSDSSLEFEGLEKLLKSLAENTHIKKFIGLKMKFSIPVFKKLLDFLGEHQSINSINLGFNDLYDDHFSALNEMILKKKSLKELRLECIIASPLFINSADF